MTVSEHDGKHAETEFVLSVRVLKRAPPRERRVLFELRHSLKYPENGYIPRDSVHYDQFAYEWKGDHLFTTFQFLHSVLA